MRKYEDLKLLTIDLSSIGGGRPYSIEELVTELVTRRRDNFFKNLFTLNPGDHEKFTRCFDAITFKAATSDFAEYLQSHDVSYEGDITYDVTAGGDWVWHCKTEITWKSSLPIAGGALLYHTTVIPNEKVESHRISAMTGTLMQIKVISNNLKPITFTEAHERDLAKYRK